jgi:hypothetical protein
MTKLGQRLILAAEEAVDFAKGKDTGAVVHEFCTKCGASFPPREGEGTCREWKECYVKQTRYDQK